MIEQNQVKPNIESFEIAIIQDKKVKIRLKYHLILNCTKT